MYQLLGGAAPRAEIDTVQQFSRVLLIEDNPAHAKLIIRALSGIVGEVTHASTARKGLESLSTELTELIFCDLHLPDISGSALLQEIRQLRPGVPLIVLTSSSTLDDAVQAMRLGAWDFMVKEFSQDLRTQMTIVVERTAERKLLESRELALRAERDAFSLAAFTAQDGLAIISGNGSVVFSNEAFQNFARLLVGYAQAEQMNNVVDLIAAQQFAVAANLRRELQAEAGRSLWQAELEAFDAAADHRSYFELSLSTVAPEGFGQLGAPGALDPALHYRVLWIRDITRRKEQERFQRDLLATTTHDLKGPLGSILTSAELLCNPQYVSNQKAVELLTRVASCARSSISIIDELLSARRIQDGVLVVRPHYLSIDSELEDVVLDYLPLARAKNIEFNARQSLEPLQVYADKIALHRVLGNLVSNALKFTPKGGRVEIFAERAADGVCIGVTDTGPGIEASARHTLFERFGRLERDRQTEGTGLGLFVTKNIVEAHGGLVEVRSQVGVGSTFLVTFPDKAPAQEASQTDL